MKLYELASAYQDFLDQADDLPEDVFADTLEALEGEFDLKADNIACIIKQLMAEAYLIEAEEKALKARRTAKRARADWLCGYLKRQMQATGRTKIETARNAISLGRITESVKPVEGFISWAKENAPELLRIKGLEADKKAIKEALSAGREIPYICLEENRTLKIV